MHPQFHGSAAMTSTVADWLLLSTCHTYVITESGFSKTAAAFNLENPRYYLFQNQDPGQPLQGECKPEMPNVLSDFKLRSGL